MWYDGGEGVSSLRFRVQSLKFEAGSGARGFGFRVSSSGNRGGALSTKGRTRPGATTKEDKAKIPSTKSQTNSKLQAQMTKTEDGGEKTNHEAHEGHEEDSWTGKTEKRRPTTRREPPGRATKHTKRISDRIHRMDWISLVIHPGFLSILSKLFRKKTVLPACSSKVLWEHALTLGLVSLCGARGDGKSTWGLPILGGIHRL